MTAVRGLVAAGLADPARLAVQGGSAGGWTVLCALTQTAVFACGISYFGVTDLLMLAADTHDFESRYLDGLVGPLPEARALYEQRAPVNNLAGLSCPVLLLQGLDDPIVPPNQAERFRDALAAKGIAHAYRAYAGNPTASAGARPSSTRPRPGCPSSVRSWDSNRPGSPCSSSGTRESFSPLCVTRRASAGPSIQRGRGLAVPRGVIAGVWETV